MFGRMNFRRSNRTNSGSTQQPTGPNTFEEGVFDMNMHTLDPDTLRRENGDSDSDYSIIDVTPLVEEEDATADVITIEPLTSLGPSIHTLTFEEVESISGMFCRIFRR